MEEQAIKSASFQKDLHDSEDIFEAGVFSHTSIHLHTSAELVYNSHLLTVQSGQEN